MLTRVIVLASTLSVVATAASAQVPAGSDPLTSRALSAGQELSRSEARQSARRSDSLANGILVGAGLGAAAGAFTGSAVLDCSECAGFNVPLTFGVIGAGAGAAIGAVVDKLWPDRSDRRRARPQQRLTVTPVVGGQSRGLVGRLRF